jgi:[glutamine synthetase] adenylyltransferase / [glutamine synthetase]-adenylyl-L-tyrosine phosphorylase
MLPERISARIQLLLASMPDPERASRCLARIRNESPSAFDRITSSPAALRAALHLFSYSHFLTESVIRSPERILQVANSGTLYRVMTVEEFEERLWDSFSGDPHRALAAMDLARFRRRQLMRIVLRDVLGTANLAEVTTELSSLADAILAVAYRRIRAELVERHGEPRLPNGARCGFSVISLGKLGGGELNYSSDVDLMFVYAGNGITDGPVPLSNKEFYKKVANQYTELLSAYTPDGQCYRVDLRLRPDGAGGEICISQEGAETYYRERARDWEKQMLVKARVSAGEPEPGRALLDFVEPLIYRSSLDFRAVEAVSETRQRISEKMAAKRGVRGLNIKLTPGGIRDIEFLVQCLQRLHGGREPWVRHAGTMQALVRLRDKELVSTGEYARLATAYQFLRNLEHRLQMEDDRQTHTLPQGAEALDLLARKMPRETSGAPLTAESLRARIEEHLAAVREIYERVIHAQPPLTYTMDVPPPRLTLPVRAAPPPAASKERPAEQATAPLPAGLSAANIHRGRERFQNFLEKIAASASLMNRLDADPKLSGSVVDIFEHSPYFADTLIRYPELVNEIGEPVQLESVRLEDGAALRRFYRRQMFRIQCASMLDAEPIFETLAKTSTLADLVLAAAYQLAIDDAGPEKAAGVPGDQMMVIALGRLGLREFDLGSDADLVFVIPDQAASDLPFWTAVAERIINHVSAYTREGVMFAIDTRLRPSGGEGDLVQTEGAYKSYFASKAEAWEGISYMKSRAVAGNLERATEFLHELQDVDWRRYGQAMRSRNELAAMRARLEREQGQRNPLKAGMGGYYDIDFALMFLRLKGAGIFFKVLNTPERIDVIEKMGHLDRDDADFLRDAATFYRAIDHGQRVSTGHAEGSLPDSEPQMEVLTNLVRRWTPEHLHNQPLEVELREVRERTRQFFNRLFAR